jgi:hypothetical protein
MMACDDNKINDINPYTSTGTFGVSWNGGYKPDDTLEYVRPFDNIVKPSPTDDFTPPMYLTPSNVYLKTQEARRNDIMTGGIPTRIYEDRECELPSVTLSTNAPTSGTIPQDILANEEEPKVEVEKILLFAVIVLATIFLVSLKNK